MKRAAIAECNALITIPGARVVVAGGTQGIGAGIACRFAMAGAEVWIIGRNETKGVYITCYVLLSVYATLHTSTCLFSK